MGMDVFGRKTFGGGQWNVGSRLSCFCRGKPANRCSLEQHVLPRLSDDSNAPFSVRFFFQGELLLDNLPLHLAYSLWPPQVMHVKSKGGLAAVMNERIRALVAPSEMHGLFHKFSGVIMPHQVRKMASEWIIHGVLSPWMGTYQQKSLLRATGQSLHILNRNQNSA